MWGCYSGASRGPLWHKLEAADRIRRREREDLEKTQTKAIRREKRRRARAREAKAILIFTRATKRSKEGFKQRARALAIIEETAAKYDFTVEQISGPYRDRAFTRAKEEIGYRIRTELGWSMPRIGKLMGNRDHTTVLYWIRRYCKHHGLPVPVLTAGQWKGAET